MKSSLPVFAIPVFAVAVAVLFSGTSYAEQFALVIGNRSYDSAPILDNAANDANDVGASLSAAGWDVTTVVDQGIHGMLRSLREFSAKAEGAEAALFFYAGHGIEVKGENYLLPIDAALADEHGEDALYTEALALSKVMEDLGRAEIRLKTVVLDCCRDNPLSRSWLRTRSSGGGLAEIKEKDLPEGTMIVFSTAPGFTAADGDGRNSPFTDSLLQRMKAGGGGLSDVFADVAKNLGAKQPAWIRFDGSGVSFTAFRDYPMIPGGVPSGNSVGNGVMKPVINVPPIPSPKKDNIRGTHTGSYTYGGGYTQSGTVVNTTIEITQQPGSERFTGVMTEPYTNFGTPKYSKLWADVEGTVFREKSRLKVKFVKTYRYFEQEAPQYEGYYDEDSKMFSGKWYFPGSPTANGEFRWNNVILKN